MSAHITRRCHTWWWILWRLRLLTLPLRAEKICLFERTPTNQGLATTETCKYKVSRKLWQHRQLQHSGIHNPPVLPPGEMYWIPIPLLLDAIEHVEYVQCVQDVRKYIMSSMYAMCNVYNKYNMYHLCSMYIMCMTDQSADLAGRQKTNTKEHNEQRQENWHGTSTFWNHSV